MQDYGRFGPVACLWVAQRFTAAASCIDSNWASASSTRLYFVPEKVARLYSNHEVDIWNRDRLRRLRTRCTTSSGSPAAYPGIWSRSLVFGANRKRREEGPQPSQVFANSDCSHQRSLPRCHVTFGNQETVGYRYYLLHCGAKTAVSDQHGRTSPRAA